MKTFLVLIFVLGIVSISNLYDISAQQSEITFFPPPMQQIKNGIEPTNVTCTEGLQLVLKKLNGMPACVKPASVEPLINRGWAIHVLPDITKDGKTNSEVLNTSQKEITFETVNYFDGVKGFLAKPETSGIYPGVIMIHEWWGLNENINKRQKILRQRDM